MADLEFFHSVDAAKVTIHFSMSNPMKFITYIEETLYWYKALQKLVPEAEKFGIKLLIEHFRCNDLSLSILENLFAQFSQIGFHLDVGHANLSVSENMTPELLRKFGNRLAHVHISDNFGVDDLHLPLYCGNIDWNMIVKNLKSSDYNDTITLEVFSENDEYLLLSKKYLKKLWEEEI